MQFQGLRQGYSFVFAPYMSRIHTCSVSSLDAPATLMQDLCNCEFSLAYGAKILLNNARLRLKRGKRYGLCGPNGGCLFISSHVAGICS